MTVRLQFEPRLVTTLAAAAAIAATLALANWQLGRAHEKEAAGARLERLSRDAPVAVGPAALGAADVEWRRVVARGRFEPRYAVFVDNRIYRGVAGFHVYMPLRLGESERHVLVNRGWVAGTPERAGPPPVRTPQAAVEVSGIAVIPGTRFLELSSQVFQDSIWQNLTLERYRDAFPVALQPFVIQQDSALDDGLVRAWDPPDLGIDKHYGYAFQWLALSATVLVFYLVTHVKRRPPQEPL